MKKIVRIIAVLLAALMLFTACEQKSSFLSVNRVTTQNSHGFTSRHDLLRGEVKYNISVPKGTEKTLEISVATEKGTIRMSVGKSGCEPVYEGDPTPLGNFTVNLTESGKYIFTVSAQEHCGSYSVGW